MKREFPPEEAVLRRALVHELCKSTVRAPIGIGVDVVEWVRVLVEQTNKDRAELEKLKLEVQSAAADMAHTLRTL